MAPDRISRIARRIIRGVVRLYYPDIEVSGRERIPANGPVLLAANHANSILDPPILGIASQRPVHFLAKAPLFQIPVIGPAFESAGMIPAFRGQDDPSQVGRNYDSLHAAAERLVHGAIVGIFPEGKSHDLPHVEPVKSGAARIAFDAVKSGARDLRIVPIGINYERKEAFRSAVWVRVAEPIEVAPLLDAHGGDEPRARRALTQEIDRRLKEAAIHIEDPALEPELDDLEVFLPARGKRRPAPIDALRQRKRIADAMNHFLTTDPSRAAAMADQLREYRAALAADGLVPRSPIMRYRRLRLLFQMLRLTHGLVLGLVPGVVGAMHHALPVFAIRRLADRFGGRTRTTLALLRLGIGIPVLAAWYVGTWFLVRSIFLPWVAWTWTLTMPFCGLVALATFRRLRGNFRNWWSQVRLFFNGARLAQLRARQAALQDKLAAFQSEYAREHPPEPDPEVPLTVRRIAWVTFRWLLILAAVAGVWTGLHWWMATRAESVPAPSGPDLGALSAGGLARELDEDEPRLVRLLDEGASLHGRLERFQGDIRDGKRSWYRQADNDAARALLLAHLNQHTALLRLLWKYTNPDRIADERQRLRAFLVQFAAASAIYESSLRFVGLFDADAEARRKFNEAEPLWNVPPGVFDSLRRRLVLPGQRELLETARRRYAGEGAAFERLQLKDAPHARFHRAIADCEQTTTQLKSVLAQAELEAPAKAAARAGQRVAYEVQTFVSTWLGHTKVREPRAGHGLVTSNLVEQLRPQLEPGDVLVERRNWYLSNAFLPGYWPHAAIYLGPREGLARMGLAQDPRVAPHWARYTSPDTSGRQRVVIEAIGEGVVFTSLEHSVGEADAVAVLRPNLATDRIREALARAFSHAGKPYDFEFDFFSTDKLVCTELVFRAYDGDIQFPMVDVMGTRTMPATELVRKFVNERGRPGASFRFVAFIDGDEWRGRSFFGTEAGFVKTLKRPSSEWLQGLGLEDW